MSFYAGTRDVVTASGDDAASYLQGQISQDVDALGVGDNAWSLILQPQGKVDALFRITRVAPDSFLLDVDPGWGEALLARLQRFRLRVRVDLSLESWNHHAYRNETCDEVEAPIVAAIDWNGAGTDVIGPQLSDPEREAIGLAEYELLRIEAGIPAMGSELGENTIPAEAGIVERTVSFTKGCYTGQELVARIDSRGTRPPRSLHIARGAGPVPVVGDPIIVDGTEAGVFTSAVPSPEGWVGLVYLKRAFDAPLTAATSTGEASIEKIARV